ncbi:MAG: hypothetical protein VYA30_15530 [Myxococcota bacterium]|nr:hypothetical protein [Myxococcota bacterium]
MDFRHSYTPFLFEGVKTPDASDMEATLRLQPDKRPWLLRAAIADNGLANALEDLVTHFIETGEGTCLELALYTAERLELRGLRHALMERVEADPELFDGYMVGGDRGQSETRKLRFEAVERERPLGEMAGYSLSWLAIEFLLTTCIPGDPILGRAKAHAAQRPSLQGLAWRSLDPSELPDAISWIPDFLFRAPQFANEVGTQFALVSPMTAERLARRCRSLPASTKSDLAHALEKNLLRTGRVKVWVACRQALADVESEYPSS